MVKIHAATGQKTTAGNILSAVWHTPVEVKGQTAGMDETDMPSSLQVYSLDSQYSWFVEVMSPLGLVKIINILVWLVMMGVSRLISRHA